MSNDKPETVQSQASANLLASADISKVFASLSLMSDFSKTVTEHITSPFDVETPKDKVKKRPDGYDYIANTWMDKQFKVHSPLYKTRLVHYSEAHGWITVVVELEDRITGNTELGADSARIMVRQGTLEPTFKDIIDKGNNVKSALSRAIKNAQSRFGHGADVYGKREETRSDAEIERFNTMLSQIKSISKTRASIFEDQWVNTGVDFSEFLDRWQVYIDKNNPSSSAEVITDAPNSRSVTEDKERQSKSNASTSAKGKLIL